MNANGRKWTQIETNIVLSRAGIARRLMDEYIVFRRAVPDLHCDAFSNNYLVFLFAFLCVHLRTIFFCFLQSLHCHRKKLYNSPNFLN